MAIRWAVASGNWSNTATWDGGTLPTSSDDVYADGKSITIDQNVTVLSIRNTQRSGGLNAGTFAINGGNFLVIADWYVSTTSVLSITGSVSPTLTGNLFLQMPPGSGGGCMTFSTSGTTTINGNITGTAMNSSVGISLTAGLLIVIGNVNGGTNGQNWTINVQNTSRAEVTGIVTGGSGNSGTIYVSSTNSNALIVNGTLVSGSMNAVLNISTGTVTINGDQTAAGTAGVPAILNYTGVININGSCYGALSTNPSTAFILSNSGTGVININGDVISRSVGPSATIGIINNASTGTINIAGNISGGSVANAVAVSNSSTGIINQTGASSTISGGSHATNTPAIYSTTAGIIDITGSIIAGVYPAIWNTSITSQLRLKKNASNTNGIVAYFSPVIKISPTAIQSFTFQDTNNINRVLSSSNVSSGVPLESDVRFGITYGSLNEYTGTCYVPTPSNVRKSVNIDNTLGTAELTAADFWDYSTTSMNTVGSIGERLKSASTIETTGDQLAAYQV